MPSELVVERDKLESFLPILGAEVTEEGYIRDTKTGEIIESEDGRELAIDEIGYLGHGSIKPIEDDFSAIVAHLSERDFREEV